MRDDEDPNLKRKEAIYLPRMAWEIGSIQHDMERQLNPIHTNVKANRSTGLMKTQFVPTPYNITFNLMIYVKNREDGDKIVEQILPYFTPEFNITAELVPDLGIQTDIPIILNSVELDDNRVGEFAERSSTIWTLTFTMKAWFYGPVAENKIIRFANVSIYIPGDNIVNIQDAIGVTPAIDRVTVQPGLTANGEPTSNASLSIPIADINADDDYGYVTHIYGIIENG